MGRKKVPKQNADSLRVWRDDHRIQLLAWLDFCLEQGLDFDKTIVDHLKFQTGKDFTARQIRDKLRGEWARDGDHRLSRATLRSKGTKGLAKLDDTVRKKIQEILCDLRASEGRYALRNRASRERGWSRAKSTVSRSTRSNVSGPDSSKDKAVAEAASPSKKKFNVSSTGSVADSRQTTEESNLQTNITKDTESLHFHHETSTEANDSLVKADNARLQLQLEAAKSTVAHQQNYILSLENRLSIAREDCKIIKDHQETDQQGQLSLSKLRFENIRLQKAIVDIANYNERETLVQGGHSGISRQKIRQEFYVLASLVRDACSSLLLRDSLPSSDSLVCTDERDDLRAWLHQVAGSSFAMLRSRVSCQEISGLELLHSVVAAGICSLVFDSAFPDFMPTESPLLDQYRRHILAKDGPHALQQLELQSNISLIETQYFKSTVIEDKSRELSHRLAASLRSLLLPDQDISDGHASPRHEALQYADLSFIQGPSIQPADAVYDAILSALRLKTLLVTCQKRFQLSYILPGTRFDSATMKQDYAVLEDPPAIRQPKRPRIVPDVDEEVRLCVFPALYQCTPPSGSDNDPVAGDVQSCLLDSKQFVTDGNLEGYVLVAKAVVLV